ncbi:jg20162 [Pararge aegeria aegeria]|uniref:Jg20162 protein n=1 Tax=Pararge aegeria aegeria TaxID=348720 RepID=A0A8S4RYI1_9NEOP|nr:jg20162 [Pararge aegeria aegeria]
MVSVVSRLLRVKILATCQGKMCSRCSATTMHRRFPCISTDWRGHTLRYVRPLGDLGGLSGLSSAGWSDPAGSRTSGTTYNGRFQPTKYGDKPKEEEDTLCLMLL